MTGEGGRFRDRREAGRFLAERLGAHGDRDDVIVLGLPRGGVPVAQEVARALGSPLDVFLVRKLGFPGQPELAMGAIASGGIRVLNEELLREVRLTPEAIEGVTVLEAAELERREAAYRGDRGAPAIEGKTVILVDDGLATGSTMRAAIAAVRSREPRRVVVAVPAAPPRALDELRPLVDELVCVITPDPFHAVGLWYEDFREVTDGDVRRAVSLPPERAVVVAVAGGERVEGGLVVPRAAAGLVVFAHGSGSSRFSPRNRYVAGVLNDAGFATLLVDLLTRSEEAIDERTAELRFDIGLLSQRLLAAFDWVGREPSLRELAVGLFGASTGAGAALVAAACAPEVVRAVVSRGGRPDLAGAALRDVTAPTLLVVGSRDEAVFDLNRHAMAEMGRAEVVLEIVPNATHLFPERGALERASELARDWFERHLPARLP